METQLTGYDAFLAALKAQGMTSGTISGYLSDLNQFCRFFGFTFEHATSDELSSLHTPHVYSYFDSLAGRGICRHTLKRSLSSVRRMYDALLAGGYLHENPARAIRLKTLPEKRLPDESIVAAFTFLENRTRYGGRLLNARDQLILLFMLFLGVHLYRIPRLSLLDLKKDGLGLLLRVTAHRLLPVDGVVLKSLHAYLALRPYACLALFVDVTGRHAIFSSAVGEMLKTLESSLKFDTSLIHPTSLWLESHTEESDALLESIEPHLA